MSFEELKTIQQFHLFYPLWKEYLNTEYSEQLFNILLEHLNYCYDTKSLFNNNEIYLLKVDIISELYELFKTYQENKFSELQDFYTKIIIEVLELKHEHFMTLNYNYTLFRFNYIKKIISQKYYNENLEHLFELYLISYYKFRISFIQTNCDDDFYFIYYYEELINKSKFDLKNAKLRSLIHLIKADVETNKNNTTFNLKNIMRLNKLSNVIHILPEIALNYFFEQLKEYCNNLET